MKSHTITRSLLQVTEALFEDIAAAYPGRPLGLDRDLLTVKSQVKARGLGFFTLDLPELDRYLLRSLSSGSLSSDVPQPFSKEWSTESGYYRPLFLKGLWEIAFPRETGLATRDASASTAIFLLRQVFCLGKKIKVPCSDARTDAAVEEYVTIERQMVGSILNWDEEDHWYSPPNIELSAQSWYSAFMGPFGVPKGDRALLDRFFACSRQIFAALGDFSGHPDSWDVPGPRGSKARHGPGAVSDQKASADKYLFSVWPRRLEALYPFHEWGLHNANPFIENPDIQPADTLTPSRLIAVPKTAKGPRLIAAEPTCNMWCQQHLADVVFRRAGKAGLLQVCNWKDQKPSRELAAFGSKDGSLTTIDLSSASDRLPLRYMEVALSGNLPLMRAFYAMRTPALRVEVGQANGLIKLKKFATQGTALTFPFQTLFFTSILYAVSGDKSLRSFTRRKDVRVYGDDIICPNKWYDEVDRLLTLLGLKVNRDKSFHTGFFRESCGLDAWLGDDVTPLKPRVIHLGAGPSSVTALVDTANNFFMKGLWHTAKAVERELGGDIAKLPIKGTGDGYTGLISFCGSSFNHLAKKWNKHLHRYEFLVLTFRSEQKVKDTCMRSRLLQYFTEAPKPDTNWESGKRGRPILRKEKGWYPLPT